MPAQEFYVEGIIQINITICKSLWKVLFVSNAEIPTKRVCPYTFKVPGLRGSQGILISHLIWKGFYEHKSLCSVFKAHVGVSAVPCAEAWLLFKLGWNDQGDNNGDVEFRVGWETLRNTGSCAPPGLLLHQGQFYSGLHRHNLGSFVKLRHLISLQLIDFNGVYSFNFYNGVRESRVWLEAMIVLRWQMEWVKCAESNPLQGKFQFCNAQTLICQSRFLVFQGD